MDDKTNLKLKKLLKNLAKIRGRHTELVTVYIPAGYKIIDVINQLKQEQGTAANIKSKATRKNVMGALEKAIQHMKVYKRTPENGLAIFSGNVSGKEGVADIKVWGIEPPEKLKTKMYWCGQTFRLEPLEEMIKEKEVYGLVVLDLSEATFGILRGKTIQVVRHIDSIVPGKTAKGGQSAQRFERVRDGLINDYFKTIAEAMKKIFPKENKGILLGGPGPAKNDLFEKDYLHSYVKKNIIGVIDTGYADEHGLHEMIERGRDVLAKAAVAKEKALLQKFFAEMQKGSGLVTYGFDAVRKALEAGAVDVLLLSEEISETWEEGEYQCGCGFSYKKFVKDKDLEDQKCPKCGRKPGLIGHRDIIEAFEEMTEQYGSKLEIISRGTREGEQLFQLGGIGAVLRYKLQY